MKDSWEVLRQRGFIAQCSDVRELLHHLRESITFYVGFDPTAASLQIGNMVPILAMHHLQDCGHQPIVIGGGGTARIGDPSGRDKMRPIMSYAEIDANLKRLMPQFGRFLRFGPSTNDARLINNAQWLTDLNLTDFMREIGVEFPVSEMLASAVYKERLGKGLTFAEMCYQLLQAYDFLVLFDRYHCILQMGGDDQWGNILAGVDLIRRLRSQQAFALTFPLLTTATGQKMGKTAEGTIWLNAQLTSPFEFFQYWQAQPDQDLERNLKIFTLLPLNEIRGILKSHPREAQLRLAFEVTQLVHGEVEARRAAEAANAAFAKLDASRKALPTTPVKTITVEGGLSLIDVLVQTGLCTSKSEARRVIAQGGAYLDGQRIEDINHQIRLSDFINGAILLRRGKKVHRLHLE